MKMMIAEVYNALVNAGAEDEKAWTAASAVADYNDAVKADLMLLKWMIGFNLVFSVGILWRVFILI